MPVPSHRAERMFHVKHALNMGGNMIEPIVTATLALYESRQKEAQRRIDQDKAVGRDGSREDVRMRGRYAGLIAELSCRPIGNTDPDLRGRDKTL